MRTYPPCDFEDDPAGKLAEFAANAKYEDLPPAVIDRAKMALLDTLAVIIGGSGRNSSPVAAAFAKRYENQAADARVMVYGYKCPAPIAAVPNGTFGRALDYGDCHVTGGHMSEYLIPTLFTSLNLGDRPFTGKDFILAFAVGSEWGTRHHTSYNFQYHSTEVPAEAGWVQSTAALAKFLGLDKQQFWNAMGLAYTACTFGEDQKNNEGSEGARLAHGFVSSTSIKACLLAKEGMTGPHSIYFGEGGILRHIIWDDVDPSVLTDDLGKRWMFEDPHMSLTIKPYAACKFTHSCIYCMLRLRELHNIDHRDIADIHCIVAPNAGPVLFPSRWEPKSMGDLMYGLPYTQIQAAMYGDVQLDAFTDERLTNNEEMFSLLHLVHYSIDDSKDIFDGYTVEVTLKDGTKYSYTDDGIPGSVRNPMSWEQLEKKYWQCVPYSAVALAKEKLETVVEMCKDLENVNDLNELMDNLVP